MQSMSVNPAQVSALSGQIRNGANGIRGELDNLESEVGKLRASWDGEAQVAYDQAQREWSKSLVALQQLLEQISGKTEEIAQTYTQSDKSSSARFSI